MDLRQIVNAILYVLCTGCAWRYLPKDYPKYKTVYHYFAQWRDDGTWHQVHERLRHQTMDPNRGVWPFPSPSLAVADSQSVSTAPMVHEHVGYDGAKKIKGRKRHLLVDSLGIVLTVVLTAAKVSKGAELKQLLHQTRRAWV